MALEKNALRFESNQPHNNASPKLVGFFLCVANNVFERQTSDNLSRIWNTGMLFGVNGKSRISKFRW